MLGKTSVPMFAGVERVLLVANVPRVAFVLCGGGIASTRHAETWKGRCAAAAGAGADSTVGGVVVNGEDAEAERRSATA